MRLIDANAALRKVEQIPFIVNENKAFHDGCRYMQKKVLRIFNESKAIEAEPVRHGRCDYCKDGKTFIRARLLLGNDGKWHEINYCPNCGAKMDLED